MDGRPRIRISLTPEEAGRFRAWQKLQRERAEARAAQREAAEREDWQTDPDAWKGDQCDF